MRFSLPAIIILSLTLIAPTAIRADADAAEATLKAKGLSPRGRTFVLDDESTIAKSMFEVRKAKKEMETVIRKFRTIEQRISRAKALIAHHEYEQRKLNKELAETTSAARQNQLIAKHNALTSEIKEAREYRKTNEAKMNKAYDDARQQYAQAVLTLDQKAQQTSAQYKTLSEDKEVTDALAAISEAGPAKVELGPSRGFLSALNLLQRYRDEILSQDIELRREGNIFWVDVFINGSSRHSMVLDSGASLISIPHDLAAELDISPGEKHPTIRIQLADGKIVDGKLVTLKSVRVGEFVVENVECAVLPPDLVAAQPLLGNTFLNEFSYKIDTAGGKLSLTKIKTDADRAREREQEKSKK